MKKIVRKVTVNGEDYYWKVIHDYYEGSFLIISKNGQKEISRELENFQHVTPGYVRGIIENPEPPKEDTMALGEFLTKIRAEKLKCLKASPTY